MQGEQTNTQTTSTSTTTQDFTQFVNALNPQSADPQAPSFSNLFASQQPGTADGYQIFSGLQNEESTEDIDHHVEEEGPGLRMKYKNSGAKRRSVLSQIVDAQNDK